VVLKGDFDMKKACLLALLVLIGLSPLFAQDQNEKMEGVTSKNESDYYYVDFPIEKIFPYRLGYVIIYRRSPIKMGTTYLPISWFESGSASKGEYVELNNGSEWPHFTVFYKNKKFNFVRLFVRKDMHDPTWGNLRLGVNLDDKFKNVESPHLTF
jgi:hypothetical protein